MYPYRVWIRATAAALAIGALTISSGCESRTESTPGSRAPVSSDAVVGLEVGNRAPEIEGEDVEGNTFRLSDYRGKVVMLDFWGDW